MKLHIQLAPEILFEIAGFPVTNVLLWMVFITIALVIVSLLIVRNLKFVPGLWQNIFEVLFEGGWDFIRTTVGSEKKTSRLFPLVFTLFIFILVCNLFVFIPGQAALFLEHGESRIPVFRAVMSDYGLIFMMTMVTVITAQIVAIIASGPFGYIGRFFNFKGVKEFFVLLFKGKFTFGALFQGFLDFFLGLMELVGELAKIFSLSFRLFGNIFAGEVLAMVMFFLAPFIMPLPFLFLALLAAFVQAFVFSVLTLVFINMASEIETVET